MANVGVDLVHIPGFQKRLERSGGVEKVFTDAELAQNTRPENLAGVFAAKEAFMKAVRKKIDWREVWIEKQDDGQPMLVAPLLKNEEKARLSISHDGDYAIAVVILEKA